MRLIKIAVVVLAVTAPFATLAYGAAAVTWTMAAPSAGLVVTVTGVQPVRDALAVMRREGWRFDEPVGEPDPFDQIPGLTKKLPHGTVDVVVDLLPDTDPAFGGSGTPTWTFEFTSA
ncbi:hypothetical protein AB0C27_45835 [Nonomuraea sp. NPDC048882]|uniref:hypothetical protein n=1 Tax=Nonomuraea sp. NPDC048882 TaxID=3154347 RepID=UPI00340BF72B